MEKELRDFLASIEEQLLKVQTLYDLHESGGDKRALGSRLDNLNALKLKIILALNTFATPEQEEVAKKLLQQLEAEGAKDLNSPAVDG